MSRIIFLDIDGVLVTDRTYAQWKRRGKPKTLAGYVSQFDPDIMGHVNTLASTIGADVVVTSSWRALHVCEIPVNEVLQAGGLVPTIVGHTPSMGAQPRGHEIAAWLVEHPEIGPSDIVILDDDVAAAWSPLWARFRHGARTILTPERYGFLPKYLDRALKLFPA